METILQVLNFLCIAPNLFVKFPQVRNVFAKQSVKGLSFNGAVLETIVYMVGLLYYFTNGFPFMAYAEYVALEVQALMMVLIIIHFDDVLDVRLIPMAAVFFMLTGLIGSGTFPSGLIAFLFSLNTPLNASSKLLQLNTIYKAQNSGSASFLMWLILGLTSLGRIITTLMTKPDILVLINHTICGSLNFIVCAAVLYYRPSEKKFE